MQQNLFGSCFLALLASTRLMEHSWQKVGLSVFILNPTYFAVSNHKLDMLIFAHLGVSANTRTDMIYHRPMSSIKASGLNHKNRKVYYSVQKPTAPPMKQAIPVFFVICQQVWLQCVMCTCTKHFCHACCLRVGSIILYKVKCEQFKLVAKDFDFSHRQKLLSM